MLMRMVATLCWILVVCSATQNGWVENRPLVVVHYMPWFAAKTATRPWGWHWTMGKRDPEHVTNGRREIASHYYPLIGPYDSGDPDVLEYHALLMKIAGIDGAVADWYGTDDVNDYQFIDRCTSALFGEARRTGLKFGVVFEDRTIVDRVKSGKVSANVVTQARRIVEGLAKGWMADDAYLRIGNRPAFFVFGHSGLTGDEWTRALAAPAGEERARPFLLTEHFAFGPAEGIFDWPSPSKGGIGAALGFAGTVGRGLVAVPVVFPRFDDYYAQAGVQASWGSIDDNDGKTFELLLERAFAGGAPIVQIATWNDWGEGTQIEPSNEFGYRDLEAIRRNRRSVDAGFAFDDEDLRLPARIFRLRKSSGSDPAISSALDKIVALIRESKPKEAAVKLKALSRGN
jgi:hypothetical protein